MRFGGTALFVALAGICLASIFSPISSFSPNAAFVGRSAAVVSIESSACSSGFNHPAYAGSHPTRCGCPSCAGKKTECGWDARPTHARKQSTRLFADATAEAEAPEAAEAEVPAEVEAMDGIESAEEAHNAERPARESIKKKRGPRGKPLSEFEVGSTVPATVKSIASYGAFCDFGASSDGLLHISRMSKDFVEDVNSIVSQGDQIEVRIVEIDMNKKQVALSLLSAEEEQEAADAQAQQKQQREERQQKQNARRDEKAMLGKLEEAGFDSDKFVSGKVVSTVSFGAFVRINAADLNADVEGSFDGLVHISALQAGRTESVTDVVNVDDEVQVRVKGIGAGKVSLSMVSAEAEAAAAAERAAAFGGPAEEPEPEGSANWKQELESLQSDTPVFKNGPIIVDLRK